MELSFARKQLGKERFQYGNGTVHDNRKSRATLKGENEY